MPCPWLTVGDLSKLQLMSCIIFGAAILMPYPQTRMYWSNGLRIPASSDTMSRDRFFKLRSQLKVVIDDDVSEDERKIDQLWKVRPFMDRTLSGCRLQAHPECV